MAARRPPLTADALWAMKRIGTPTLSPDGAQACAPVTSYDVGKNEGTTELWLYPTRPGRAARPRRLTAGDKDSGPAWSPDGKLIAFTAKRKDDEVPQLYVIAPDGGEARRVTTLSTGCASVRWFADGKRVAFLSSVWRDLPNDAAQAKRLKERKEAKVKVHATERAEYRFWDHWLTDGREPHVFVCDVATGRCRDALAGTGLALPPWEPSTSDFDVAPDGREIAITADLADEPGMLHRTDVVTIDLATRRRRVLTASTGRSDGAPRYSPDGKVVAFLSHDTERSHVDQGHLELVGRRGGSPRAVGTAFDRAVSHVQWAPDGGSLLFTAEDRGRTGIWRLAAGVARPTLVVPGGTIGGFAQSKDGATIAFDRASTQHPPALFACDRHGGHERPLESTNAALLAKHALGEVREITVKGWGGEPVQVWLVLPPGFDPKRKWPLLHSIHGGPHTAHGDGWHFRWNAHVFAGQGYVVALVNYHGSSGFGQRFLETIVARYGEKEFADIEAATDALLRTGYVDRARLVATGGSYGGFMAAYMNGHTDRYASFVCHAGCYDWVSMMATDGYMWFHRELGAWHWDDEARVLRQSPHHHIRNARTPTLVVHGEQDFRVPATQALQYYHTLKAKGVEARLVYFPDENHWILKPQNSLRWYREFFDWIARRAPGGGRRAVRARVGAPTGSRRAKRARDRRSR
ncbi:MAG TPA: S9 family peptidase [Casimicrobiaceae bacterium]|nr:S9 family peptidase [Casimicrobiaceae bacterium]